MKRTMMPPNEQIRVKTEDNQIHCHACNGFRQFDDPEIWFPETVIHRLSQSLVIMTRQFCCGAISNTEPIATVSVYLRPARANARLLCNMVNQHLLAGRPQPPWLIHLWHEWERAAIRLILLFALCAMPYAVRSQTDVNAAKRRADAAQAAKKVIVARHPVVAALRAQQRHAASGKRQAIQHPTPNTPHPPLRVRTDRDRLYRTQLLFAWYHTAPNFARRYIFSSWSCGENCLTGAALDPATGMIYWLPYEVWFDPSLLPLTDSPLFWRIDEPIVILRGTLMGDGGGLSESGVFVFRFDGNGFRLAGRGK